MVVSHIFSESSPLSVTLGTKANTLLNLRPLLKNAKVLPCLAFEVNDWQKDHTLTLKRIQQSFGRQKVIIRSSTLAEDSQQQSYAGAFQSILNVDCGNQNALKQAIECVINSYVGNPSDQVLVQPMLQNIAVCGVITTHTLNDGAPYYTINYDDESGKTDTITGGTGVNKTVLIHHKTCRDMIESSRVAVWLNMVQELEEFFPQTPLDIEFAQTHEGQLFLLQVRPITVKKFWNPLVNERISQAQAFIQKFIEEQSTIRSNLVGNRTLLGEMSDWNPAEMISTSPRPLAVSLYRHLITDRIWRKARAYMGYRHPDGEALMLLVGGRPFIDIRNSFNSFLPASLDERIGEKIVNAWLQRLENHPELHDKVEFEVAQTALDFNFEKTFQERYTDVLNAEEYRQFKEAVIELTQNCLNLSHEGSLAYALRQIESLEQIQNLEPLSSLLKQKNHEILHTVRRLLQQCQSMGTFPFAIIARHAFIAEAFLRSSVSRGALSAERVALFKSSLETITTQMSLELKKTLMGEVSQEVFLQKYGHLRPGTYDILSLRYDQRAELLLGDQFPLQASGQKHVFELTSKEEVELSKLIEESGLRGITPNDLMAYSHLAITGRESAKFIFTRTLSAILELLASWGEGMGLSRDDISFTMIDQLLDTTVNPLLEDERNYYKVLAEEGRKRLEVTRSLRLSYLIGQVQDIYVIPLHRSAPNFITGKYIEGETVLIDSRAKGTVELKGKIVCIENADPGFDWIFTKGIAGLITKFGGSNSHMAIRCAEFQIPAAIGCGEQTFERLMNSGKIELNCADKTVKPIYG